MFQSILAVTNNKALHNRFYLKSTVPNKLYINNINKAFFGLRNSKTMNQLDNDYKRDLLL